MRIRSLDWRLLVVFCAGSLMPVAFAPLSVFPIAVLALATLFWAWSSAGCGRAAWYGFAFGCGMFAVGVSWVYVSLHNYGNMPLPLAAFTVLIFIVLLALFPAAAGVAYGWFGQRRAGWATIVFGAAVWVLMEWMRGWVLSGFPWLSLGYSQTNSVLFGWAPVLGVYGVSLAVALSAAIATDALIAPRRAILGATVILMIWGGGWGVTLIRWVEPNGEPVGVALLQGNIGLDTKWTPSQARAIVNYYRTESEQHRDRDLVVWPESAVPMYIDKLSDGFWDALDEHPADFIFGALERRETPAGERYYNTVVSTGVGSTGVEANLYRKRHLVPFGEYLPFRNLLSWFLEYLHIPMSDFSAWDAKQEPIVAAGLRVGVSVCYEDAFVEEILKSVPDASLLVNVSEDAWFGDSLAPHQRVQMAQMRAREVGRPMLRAANTGVSVSIDHNGAIVVESPQFQRWVLTDRVQPMRGSTLFATWGNALILTLLGLMLALSIGARRLHPCRR
ncbi:MAG: apolipoprotein N-acyltransferase [Gammaproteobacteria bacterium]|nr:apolipoprotein N-acyltransferase [Gammaproteobacteria bacterium]MDH3464578.1 apolipoprotein N-acyltransferase [Gammaproteobacteria bacterium]